MTRWIYVAVLASLAGAVTAHVRLTFPPARTYAFDFLDNIRTQTPCGMPPGGPVTTFAPGQRVNITWHLAYAHRQCCEDPMLYGSKRGGYKLMIIPRNGTDILANLTAPGEWVGVNNTATIMHEVDIPSMLGDYTLVLNRHAGEWATGNPNITFYVFHSCADITIKDGAVCNTDMQCSGNGQCMNNKCECKALSSGEFCQYTDDCMDNSNCNNHGECVQVSDISQTFPRAVCFCDNGYFGKNCHKENPRGFTVEMTNAEMSSYFHRALSDSMSVYYKILDATKEVEVAIKSTGNSWVALGWRPRDMNGTCRNFPVAYGTGAVAEGEPEGEPQASGQYPPTSSRRRRSVRSVRVPRDSSEDDDMQTCVPWTGSGGPRAEGPSAPETEPEASAEPEGEAEASAGSLHPMDCMDIVIGMADGERSRVGDYYTRDRSTPRQDVFYGGVESLTAAGGKEYEDHIIIKFRRKMTSNERTDYSIMNEPMHIIFARGQDIGNYVHNPPSGIELCTANQRFYKPFEIKYHGTHQDQRGQIPNFNFFEDPNAVPSSGPCQDSYAEPMNCQGDACDYRISWTYNEMDDTILFNITAKTEVNRWTAVGFSRQGQMINADAVTAFVGDSGQVVVEDRFLGGKTETAVVVDNKNNLEEVSATYENGIMRLAFRRARDTGDDQDVSLTECVNFLIPTQGGTFTKGTPYVLAIHDQTPGMTKKYCIKACEDEGKPAGNSNRLSASLSSVVTVMLIAFHLKF